MSAKLYPIKSTFIFVSVPFSEAEVLSRLGLTCVGRNVYAASLDGSERNANSGESLRGGLRSVGSLIPRSDSCILHQGLSQAMGMPRLDPSDDQVTEAKRNIGV
ncbi:hypothetical protein B296_00018723 [Ensete ventricosum]|uniref:Uncharacterized protein n=1 Tax=Ensete ventricosum TaxID=4639 RepID=A0A427B1N4_ENSVE|nr:hypothetical protein B296_00018723 [Ensete ventricosum]